MLKRKLLLGGLVAWSVASATAFAAVSADDAAHLKSDLTPFGSEKAGNKDGSIPEWTGGITKEMIPKNYTSPGQHHPDPYPGEKPTVVITKANMGQYSVHLTEGQKGLFSTYPDTFKMPIYPTHRSHALPDWVNQNTFKNATTAQLAEGGNGVINAYGGLPFPIPKANGQIEPLMVLWNHILRYRGNYIVRSASEVAAQRNGDYSLVTSQLEAFFPYYKKDGKYEDLNNIIFYYLSYTISPARLAGGAVLVHETLDQSKEPRQAWGYNAGQRRVRRAPNLAYDTPIAAADGLRTADDTDMYNGAPDRYDWKFLGKKEIYIPYNNYKLGDEKTKYADVLKVGHINPDLARYELHRVWVVQGALKSGMRHIYSKRTFYIDEDSWCIAAADLYDSRGQLWRVSQSYLKSYYEVPLTWSTLDVFHDLQAGRYHVQFLDSEEPRTIDFSRDAPPSSYFTPAALRRRGVR